MKKNLNGKRKTLKAGHKHKNKISERKILERKISKEKHEKSLKWKLNTNLKCNLK